MKRDFRDIRFSDLKGNSVPYYLESVSNYSSCRVWLALPASEEKMLMYYGNGRVQSGSNGAAVFEFWEDFLTLNTSIWTKVHGISSVSNSILTLASTTLNTIVQSVATYPVNTIVEARAYHAAVNRSIIGYRNYSTELACAWHGTVIGDTSYHDHRFTHNGSSGTWTDDGVARGGTTFHIYGVAHLAAGSKFYADYALRGTASTTLPGSTSLPIHFYSEYNKGNLCIDWVRVRKYTATEPVITLGKKFTNQPKAYPWDNAIVCTSSIGMSANVILQHKLNLTSQIGMRNGTMFRHPSYYRTDVTGPYRRWKYKGDIRTPKSASVSVVNVLINASPGMTSDGRDLRFSTIDETILKYYIESLTSGVFSVWVEIPANTTKINYFYGNGLTVSESDVSIYTETPEPVTIQHIYPSTDTGYYSKWKYKGEINITSPDSNSVQINVEIPILPGMSLDGRDLRFSTVDGVRIPYYLESVASGIITCIIKAPANVRIIYFYYGNGTAISESSPAEVFEYWDDFDTLNLDEWSIVAGSALCTASTLRISHPVANSLIRSVDTFSTGTFLEIRMYHPSLNQFICGYFGTGNLRACWLGALSTDPNNYVHTHDGTNSTSTSDGVNRSGTTFYNYGIAYFADEIKYYINGVYRRSVTTTLPTGDLPIGLYSEHNEGDVTVDWVRVRTYTEASATAGRHYPQKQSMIIIEESVTAEIATVERHYPHAGGYIPFYEGITGTSFLGMQAAEPTYIERDELSDYSFVSCDISKSTSDTYISLTAFFADMLVPPERSTVKFNAYDASGIAHLLFHGKVIANSPALSSVENTMGMQASDQSRNLAVQKIPWNYQIISGDTMSWPAWVRELLATEKTGVVPNVILGTDAESTQFSFDPSKSRLDAIEEIANYAGCIINTKLITRTVNGFEITKPEFYMCPPEYIDQSNNGFDLPAPVTLVYPDSSMVDNPTITNEPDEKYNKVIVHGVLSDTGETTVAAAYSSKVYLGDEKANEYIVEDNSIYEKGSTAEIEAIKWLLYFLAPRATVSLKFINRFDFELYQRVKFGAGFPNTFNDLTGATQTAYVACCDPRDEANSTHIIDTSGVPTPSWLRISEIKYHCEPPYYNTTEIKLISDYIYSVTDPIVSAPYSAYLSPGYRKPIIDDLIATTQSIVDNTVEKQLQPEICTVLSQNLETKTAVVQTASGKLVTVRLP